MVKRKSTRRKPGALESVILAFLSGDPVWDKVLRNGGDLHSTCARLVFGLEWTDVEGYTAPDDIVFKAKTKKGKVMRQHVKAISFGLA